MRQISLTHLIGALPRNPRGGVAVAWFARRRGGCGNALSYPQQLYATLWLITLNADGFFCKTVFMPERYENFHPGGIP